MNEAREPDKAVADSASAVPGPLPTSAPETTPARVTIEAVHRDLAFSNSYRLELLKISLTIPTALLAFIATLRPALVSPNHPDAMWVGLIALGLSIVGGMMHMASWDYFYRTYRDYDYKGDVVQGKAARTWINGLRALGMLLQYGGLLLGVGCIVWFTAANLDTPRKKLEASLNLPAPELHRPPPAGTIGFV